MYCSAVAKLAWGHMNSSCSMLRSSSTFLKTHVCPPCVRSAFSTIVDDRKGRNTNTYPLILAIDDDRDDASNNNNNNKTPPRPRPRPRRVKKEPRILPPDFWKNQTRGTSSRVRVPKGYWKDKNNRKQFFDFLAVEFNIKKPEDWYKVTLQDVYAKGGQGVVSSHYGNSIIRALQDLYPEQHEWQPTGNPNKMPRGYWKDPKNHRAFLDRLAKEELHLSTWEDWYNVSIEEVSKRGGSGLLQSYYNNSLVQCLQAVYPEHPWDLTRFSKVASGLWKDLKYQRQLLDSIGKRLGVEKLDDWYGITIEDVKTHGGGGLLTSQYNGSLIRALQTVYPEHDWKLSVFIKVPSGHWDDPANQRAFFDRLAKQLNISNLDEWYNVTVEEVCKRGGRYLLKRFYGESLMKALATLYPEHPWEQRAPKAPRGHWSDLNNQRQFFDELAKELNFKSLDDWYTVKYADIASRGCRGFMQHRYHNSLYRALKTLYPEHPWVPWKFNRVVAVDADDILDSIDNDNYDDNDNDNNTGNDASHAADKEMKVTARDYMDALARELSIKHLDDWYRVSMDQIKTFGGERYLKRLGGLYLVLKKLHPEHQWDEARFADHSKKSTQRWLKVAVARMLPNHGIVEEYIHPDLKFSETHGGMELDVFVPSLSLAFEYHGEQHYRDVFHFGPHSTYQRHDDEKVRTCQQLGITLVGVPYWWDRSLSSLAATVLAVRPDLKELLLPICGGDNNAAQPIPLVAPTTDTNVATTTTTTT